MSVTRNQKDLLQQVKNLQEEVASLQSKNSDLEEQLKAYSFINTSQISLINKLMERVPFGVMMINDRQEVIHANPAAAKIFNTTTQQMERQHCNQYFQCYDAKNSCPVLSEDREFNLRSIPCANEDKHILHSAFVSDEGSERVVMETFIDVTEIKKAEEELIRINKTKDEFLGMISHELRTPLNVIQGYGSLLQEELQRYKSKDKDFYLEKIMYSGEQLHEIVNNLLELSDLTAGKIQADFIPIDLEMIISQLQYRLEKEFTEHGNTLHFDYEAIEPFEQDLALLMKALYELLNNANKFTENGTVTMSVKLEQKDGADWLNFTVEDTGCGMTAQTVEQIFEAFHQADSSLSRTYEGLGLGLSRVEKIVHIINGHIEVESELGVGSRFSVMLPYERVQQPLASGEI